MKLLFCRRCGDVRKLQKSITYCECGHVYGSYRSDGAHALVSPDAEIIGIDNHTLQRASAARDHADSGYRTLAAWLMGKDAPRVEWERKA